MLCISAYVSGSSAMYLFRALRALTMSQTGLSVCLIRH